MTSPYRSRLKISVMLMFRPSAIIRSIGPIPSAVAGDLHHQIAAGDPLVEVACRGLGARFVVGEAGFDLDAHEAVDAVGRVVHRVEHVAGSVDVLDDEGPVVVLDRTARVDEFAELVVVVARSLDRLLEDGRVRGEPADAAVAQHGEFARGEVPPLEVVEPGALALFVEECLQSVRAHRCSSLPSLDLGHDLDLPGPFMMPRSGRSHTPRRGRR